MPNGTVKFLARLVVLGIAVFVALQFVRPSMPNPPVTAEIAAPPEVKEILRTSCFNCHSNETQLSWFDKPVPAYWLVSHDVKEGRAHMNFSEFDSLPAAKKKAMLFQSVAFIEMGAMPLPQYLPLHPEAKVTPEKLEVLRKYLVTLSPPLQASESDAAAADSDYQKWISSGKSNATSQNIPPAPNGFAFPADYKNWKVMSSTDRWDNSTIREILANDVAVRAIAEHKINPWPDGATFAKVTWHQAKDANGTIKPGAFFLVEFMSRDSKKYADTLGWGWGRWLGPDLKPYGENASFTKECVSCHSPLKNSDGVYTLPLRGQQ